ncbi:MAG: LysE family transporter [Bacteroidales bacterium]|jgi:threonine/homoserine/homoserine lactone efflux protein|nr:LysE family transporter [Bacteroidales bacterium]MDD3384276.1 LysE family transporter [Bacteroidales bacterium]MDD3871625.1 LysE family transporter [Bacteroidales bacterium]
MIFLILLKGILTGLLLTVYVGATFFTVMETVLRRGVWAALLLNAGVWISDIGCIVLAYYGAAELMQPLAHNIVFKLIAAAAFLFFGLTYFLRKPTETVKPLAGKGAAILLIKGFAINTLNPGVLVFWFATMTFVVTIMKLTGIQILYYFSATILTLILFDVLKIVFSAKLRRLVNENLMTKLFRITGVILIAFGIFVIIKALWS